MKRGHRIWIDIPAWRPDFLVDADTITYRRLASVAPPPVASCGYTRHFLERVQQANRSCEFDCLIGSTGDSFGRYTH